VNGREECVRVYTIDEGKREKQRKMICSMISNTEETKI